MTGLDRILPLAPIDRLIRKAAERVSNSAAEAMEEVLREIGLEIAEMANDLAAHAKRKTVTKDDIELAHKQWRNHRR